MSCPRDRRDSSRLVLDRGRAMATVGRRRGVVLTDLAVGGCGLVVRDAGDMGLGLASLEIALAGGPTLRARIDVVRARSPEPGVLELGARFVSLTAGNVCALARFMACELGHRAAATARLLDHRQSVKLTSPLFIRNLFAGRAPRFLSVLDGSVRLPGQLRLDGIVREGGRRALRTHLLGDLLRLAPDRPYTFVMHDPGALTLFESHRLGERGLDLTLALPSEVRQTGFRRSRRVAVERERIQVSFPHPRLLGTRLTGAVLEVGARGLAFRASAHEHGLFAGQRLTDLRLALPGRTLAAEAVVRSLALREGPALFAVGIELDGLDSADAEAWRRFVFSSLHPAVRPSATGWQRPSPAVGDSLVLEGDDRAATGTLVYPGTWLWQHRAGSGRPLAEGTALLRAIADRTPGEHFMVHLEGESRWRRRVYLDFIRAYPDQGNMVLARVWRRPNGDAAGIAPGDAAAPADVARRLAGPPSLARRALALEPETLDLAAFGEECARHGQGQVRRRHLFVEEDALLVADSGGGLDLCAIVPLGRRPPSRATREALLRRACGHYGRSFLVLDEDEDEEGPAGWEPGELWIGHRDVLPAWAAYLDGLGGAPVPAAPAVAQRRAATP